MWKCLVTLHPHDIWTGGSCERTKNVENGTFLRRLPIGTVFHEQRADGAFIPERKDIIRAIRPSQVDRWDGNDDAPCAEHVVDNAVKDVLHRGVANLAYIEEPGELEHPNLFRVIKVLVKISGSDFHSIVPQGCEDFPSGIEIHEEQNTTTNARRLLYSWWRRAWWKLTNIAAKDGAAPRTFTEHGAKERRFK